MGYYTPLPFGFWYWQKQNAAQRHCCSSANHFFFQWSSTLLRMKTKSQGISFWHLAYFSLPHSTRCFHLVLPLCCLSLTLKELWFNSIELSAECIEATGTYCYYLHLPSDQCRVALGFKVTLLCSLKHSSLFETLSHTPLTAIPAH